MLARTITIKPNRSGQFQAYTRMAVSGEVAVSKPFAPTLIECERKHWEELKFKVVIADTWLAEVE